jgi:hypothetical protein
VLEEVLTRSVRVEGLEPEFVDEGEHSFLSGADPLSSDLHDLAVGNWVIECASTDSVPGLDDENVDAVYS